MIIVGPSLTHRQTCTATAKSRNQFISPLSVACGRFWLRLWGWGCMYVGVGGGGACVLVKQRIEMWTAKCLERDLLVWFLFKIRAFLFASAFGKQSGIADCDVHKCSVHSGDSSVTLGCCKLCLNRTISKQTWPLIA
jgi:hypothetical protein